MGSHSSRRPTPAPKSDPQFAQRRHKARVDAREASGLSLEELAAKLDRSPALIERLERTGNVPTHLAGLWSKLLDCKVDLFL
jgi:ribosome-binding protein aMBF1 (putative translation factor)